MCNKHGSAPIIIISAIIIIIIIIRLIFLNKKIKHSKKKKKCLRSLCIWGQPSISFNANVTRQTSSRVESWIVHFLLLFDPVYHLLFYNFTNFFCFLGPADLAGFLLSPFRKPKRVRTAFSPSQLLKLEHAFEKNHYVVGAERKQLAQNLNLTETQVKINASSGSLLLFQSPQRITN